MYGTDYIAKRFDALPLKDIVKIDFELPGCPPEPKLLEGFLLKIPELISK